MDCIFISQSFCKNITSIQYFRSHFTWLKYHSLFKLFLRFWKYLLQLFRLPGSTQKGERGISIFLKEKTSN